jgi:hypothetical protein
MSTYYFRDSFFGYGMWDIGDDVLDDVIWFGEVSSIFLVCFGFFVLLRTDQRFDLCFQKVSALMSNIAGRLIELLEWNSFFGFDRVCFAFLIEKILEMC